MNKDTEGGLGRERRGIDTVGGAGLTALRDG